MADVRKIAIAALGCGVCIVAIVFAVNTIDAMRSAKVATNVAPVAKVVSTTVCPNARANEGKDCSVTEEWTNWFQIADASDSGKQLCYFPFAVVLIDRQDVQGTTSWRFKVNGGGRQIVKYQLFPTEYSCVAYRP